MVIVTKSEDKNTNIECVIPPLYSIYACEMREKKGQVVLTLIISNSEQLLLSMLGFNPTTSGSNLYLLPQAILMLLSWGGVDVLHMQQLQLYILLTQHY